MYKIFKISFFSCIVFSVIFLVLYLKNIFTFIEPVELTTGQNEINMNPFVFLQYIFTPSVIFTFILTLLTQLTYMILGIVMIARNNRIDNGEKALWIIGFILANFIAAIVFLALNKSKNLADDRPKEFPDYSHT